MRKPEISKKVIGMRRDAARKSSLIRSWSDCNDSRCAYQTFISKTFKVCQQKQMCRNA